MPEVTGQQTVSTSNEPAISQELPASYAIYRQMRNHPTIAMVRALSVAPVLAGTWSVESRDGASDEWVREIDDTMIAVRDDVVPPCMFYGSCDFGWMPFEIIWGLTADGRAKPEFKSLLHDITQILIEPQGRLAGLVQEGEAGDIPIPIEKSLVVSFNVEGTNWYGQPKMEAVRRPYNRWLEADEGAARYDKKIAGSHWVVKFPVGTTDVDGTKTDNSDIAKTILAALQSSGSVIIPKKVMKQVTNLNDLAIQQSAWEIDLVSDSSPRQGSFVDSLAYIDKIMVRGFLTPERSMTEGRFGTKAEAGEHIDLSLLQRELEHRVITRQVNKQVVNRILVANFGPEAIDQVFLVAAPLVDDKRTVLKEVLMEAIRSEVGVALIDSIDIDSLFDQLGVPKSEQVLAGLSDEGSGSADDKVDDADVDPDTQDVTPEVDE